MKKDGLVDRKIHFGLSEKLRLKGVMSRHRHEYLRHLTSKGATFLDEYTELDLIDIRYSKSTSILLKNDYSHRTSTIFTHISFDRRVEQHQLENARYLLYYDGNKLVSGRKFEAETRISLEGKKHFTPDVIGSYTKLGSPVLFCLEVYNGDKVGYVVKQLVKLFTIIEKSNKVEQRIGVNAVPRILVTFDNEALQKNTMERLIKLPLFHVEGIEKLIFFKQDIQVREDFGKGWIDLENNAIDLKDIAQF